MADENETSTSIGGSITGTGIGESIMGFEELMALLPIDDLPASIERLVYDPQTGKRSLSDTPGLVNENGIIQTRDDAPYYYDLTRDPQAAYNAMAPEPRQLILDALDARGVPTGTWQQNVRAFELLYSEANRFGKTADVMFADILEKVPESKTGNVRVAPTRVTSSTDLRKIIKGVARQMTGRDLGDELADRWVQSFQQEQANFQSQYRSQSGGTIEDMASPQTSAESFIQQYAGDEVKANDFMSYFDVLGQSLRSRV